MRIRNALYRAGIWVAWCVPMPDTWSERLLLVIFRSAVGPALRSTVSVRVVRETDVGREVITGSEHNTMRGQSPAVAVQAPNNRPDAGAAWLRWAVCQRLHQADYTPADWIAVLEWLREREAGYPPREALMADAGRAP